MYFIPRNNWFYTFAVRTRPMTRYLYTFALATLIILFWLYAVYFRTEAAIDHRTTCVMQLRTQSEQLTHANHAVKKLTESIGALQREVQSYALPTNKEEELQSRVLYVLSQAQENGLELDTYDAAKKIEKPWCTKHCMHFVFSGRTQQVIAFLKTIQSSGKMISCANISLHRQDDNSFQMACDMSFVSVASDQKN